MSYLDVPRFHFGGTFFTNPGTINNSASNYGSNVGEPNGPALNLGWNPNGVALTYLRGCGINAMIDKYAQQHAEGVYPGFTQSSDPIFQATVETASPYNDITGNSNYSDIPVSFCKMVDLDPQQQGRSALWGLWVVVRLPHGGEGEAPGFYGRLTIPELRNMANRINLPSSSMLGWSYNFGGVWQCAMDDVIWTGETSVSPLLQQLRDTITAGNIAPGGKAYTGGLSMKLTMDLHRPQPESQFIDGDSFCYGRLSGTFGPMLEGEAASYAPSRRLAPAHTTNGAPPDMPTAFTTVIDKQGAKQFYFSADMGNSLYLKIQTVSNSAIGYLSLGDYETPDGYHFGYMASSPAMNNLRLHAPHTPDYQPFANGKVDFSAIQKSMPAQYKNVSMQINSGVAFFKVSEEEMNGTGKMPLVCFLNQAALFSEASDGFTLDIDTFTSRLEQDYTAQGQNWDKLIGPSQFSVQVHHFGQAYTNKTLDLEMEVQNQTGTSSDAPFVILTDNPTTTDANGKLIYTFEASSATMTLGRLRQELGSNVAFVVSNSKFLVSDNNAPMSVVVWIKFNQPDPVTWANDIEPILAEYAKLYPGMKGKLNIANKTLVLGSFNATMSGHMSGDPQGPNYMPVTRDLSPSRVGMVVSYLEANKQPGGPDAQV